MKEQQQKQNHEFKIMNEKWKTWENNEGEKKHVIKAKEK